MKRLLVRAFPVLVVLLAIGPVLAQRVAKPPAKRARPPQFDAADSSGVFFSDVFARLQGERPSNLGKPGPAAPSAAPQVASTGSSEQATSGAYPWSQIIAAAVIEDEVKAVKLKLDQEITTPGKFSGNGYKVCRQHFSVLAMLFGIVAEYDGEVRWRSEALAARDGFAKVAANCKVGTQQVYNEAKLRKQDLEDLVNGARLAAPAGDAASDWSATADRAPLMQRLEAAFTQSIQPFTSSKSEFSANADKVRHEAEITAAIADVLTKEGMEDGGDSDYAGFADRMKKAARDIVEAIKLDNHEQAREAVGEINKACSECHENYRA